MNTLALDIGGTSIKSALFDECGNILAEEETQSDGKLGGPTVMRTALSIVDGYGDFGRIGVSTSGQIHRKERYIAFANENIPGYTGMRVREIIAEHTGVPVWVENDVNCAAVGEAHYGAGRPYDDFLCLTFGTGVGGGIIIKRELYVGADGLAGEVGHMSIHPDGRPCACGQIGCYEEYASTTALVRAARAVCPEAISGRALFRMLPDHPELQHVLSAWYQEIAIGLATLTHVFNPSSFVLGGGVLDQPAVLRGISDAFYPRVMKSFAGVELKRAELGNRAGLYGAMSLALKFADR